MTKYIKGGWFSVVFLVIIAAFMIGWVIYLIKR